MRTWWQRATAAPEAKPGKPLGYWAGASIVELSPALELEQRRAFLCAVDWWNERFHGRFAVREGGEEADIGWPPRLHIITVTSHVPVGGPSIRATAEVFFSIVKGGEIGGAHIELKPGTSGKVAERAFAHELGHVLGLGHVEHATDHLMGITAPGWRLLDLETEFVRRLR